MSQQHLDPAKSIISRLGGVATVSAAINKSHSRIYRWMYPKEKAGTGGSIPQREIPKLMSLAREKGVPLRLEDFFVM